MDEFTLCQLLHSDASANRISMIAVALVRSLRAHASWSASGFQVQSGNVFKEVATTKDML